MSTDTSGLTQLGGHIRGFDNPDEARLERAPNPHPDALYLARFTAPEFTSLCPVTGQPDFAHLVIDYAPGETIVESKSLKLFLGSFRNHCGFHEDVTVGIDELRTSDPSNTPAYWRQAVDAAKRAGLKTILNIIYSISPKHTDEYFVTRAREAAKLDVARICFKDPGGLLTPEATRRLVPLILQEAQTKPVEFHTHCTTGLGPLCCLEAIQLGITSINTAIPPLADGSSNPSIFNVAMNARSLGYRTQIDEEVLKPVRDHFAAIAKRENLPVGKPLEYDALHPLHQVPGGMISNFRFQLGNLGKLDQLSEVLDEVSRVRAEFGYPIMVTPYSQFFGVQAAINVMVGERYKEVTDEVLLYALGFWGEEEAQSIEANLKDRLLSNPRARELGNLKPPEMSLSEFREKFDGAGISDDERLLHYFAGTDAVTTMRAAGAPDDYTSSSTPLLMLIEQLAKRKNAARVYIARNGFRLRMERATLPPNR